MMEFTCQGCGHTITIEEDSNNTGDCIVSYTSIAERLTETSYPSHETSWQERKNDTHPVGKTENKLSQIQHDPSEVIPANTLVSSVRDVITQKNALDVPSTSSLSEAVSFLEEIRDNIIKRNAQVPQKPITPENDSTTLQPFSDDPGLLPTLVYESVTQDARVATSPLSSNHDTDTSSRQQVALDSLAVQEDIVSPLVKNVHLFCPDCLSGFSDLLETSLQSCKDEISLYNDYFAHQADTEVERATSSSSVDSPSGIPRDTSRQRKTTRNLFLSRMKQRKKTEKNVTRWSKYQLLHEAAVGSMNARHRDAFIEQQTGCLDYQSMLSSLENAVGYNSALLLLMSKYNAFNDTFVICSQGSYGVINGLRLGKSGKDTVSWSEVNAALGQVAFLLDHLIHVVVNMYSKYAKAERTSLSAHLLTPEDPQSGSSSTMTNLTIELTQLQYLRGYKILPRGNQSVVVKRSDSSTLELYVSTGGLTRFFAMRRFNSALLILLEMTKEIIILLSFIKSLFIPCSKGLDPPFQITTDCVGEAPIRLSSATGDELWCRALKNLLINFKWLLHETQAVFHTCTSHKTSLPVG